jgi:spermidine/putrescine transport system permease protein
MIGNVIQSQFLSLRNYPTAAALSFILMGAILVLVILFSRVIGTQRLMGAAAR